MRPEHRPISPPVETGPRGADLPTYVSNGLIGLRVRENPLESGMCMVSGFVGEHHEKRVEAAVAGPYPLGGDVAIDGLWAEDQPGAVEPLDQAYDFATAELTSRLAIRGTWAAWIGDRDLSLKLLEEGYGDYQYGRFQQTLEYRLDKVPDGVASGPFVANMGGFLSGLLFGLPGLRVSSADPAEWACREVVLPAGWEAIECDRLWVRGRPMRLVARHGAARAELTPA